MPYIRWNCLLAALGRSTNKMEVMNIYELFRGEIAKVKMWQNKTNADIAKLTGYKKNTIDAFMKGTRTTDTVAQAISKALDIPL